MEKVLPQDIEKRSMEIITQELGTRTLEPDQAPVIKRVIHATADFSFSDTLYFSQDAVKIAKELFLDGACVVTDTNMAKSGINRKLLEHHGGQLFCFMADEDIAQAAKADGTTRAAASMRKAAGLNRPVVYVIGNAPTALVEVCQLYAQDLCKPAFVVGAPVGFVNVIESKELLMKTSIPQIVARGRKGGSPVAAAIVNALLYSL